MQHAGLVKVHFYSCLQALRDIGIRSQAQKVGVGTFWYHDPDIYFGQGGSLQRIKQHFGRQEIRCLYVYTLASREDCPLK